MIKKVFDFEDYEGNAQHMEAYFHLSKNDCIDLDHAFEDEGGLIEYLKTLMAEVNKGEEGEIPKESFIRLIRLLVTKSYGVRPKNDPTLFLKEDDYGRPLVRKFKGTPAYDEFVFGLLTGDENFEEFANGILPQLDPAQRAEAEKKLEAEGLKIPKLVEE